MTTAIWKYQHIPARSAVKLIFPLLLLILGICTVEAAERITQLIVASENGLRAAHRTHLYQTNQYLVVRRGFPIRFRATLDSPLSSGQSFTLQSAPSYIFDINSIQVNHVEGNTYNITAHLANNCPVGTHLAGAKLNDKSGTVAIPNRLAIIFNPYNAHDEVFYPDERAREEFLNNDRGITFRGAARQVQGVQWYYAQFIPEAIRASLHYVDQLKESDRRSPVRVIRHLTACLTVQPDHPDGLMEGKWTRDFGGGTNPNSWIASDQILRQFVWSGFRTVRWAQCWVYGALLNTVGRAMGYPIQQLSNFDSAHEMPDVPGVYKQEIVRYWDQYSRRMLQEKGQIWNFHSWNMVYLKNPDLPAPYNQPTWHTVDATPQEQSQGKFQLGPSPIAAVRAHDVKVPFDSDFVTGEVSAKVRNYLMNCWGGCSVVADLGTDRHVPTGTLVVVKQVGGWNQRDITHMYHTRVRAPEGYRPIEALSAADDDVVNHNSSGIRVRHNSVGGESGSEDPAIINHIGRVRDSIRRRSDGSSLRETMTREELMTEISTRGSTNRPHSPFAHHDRRDSHTTLHEFHNDVNRQNEGESDEELVRETIRRAMANSVYITGGSHELDEHDLVSVLDTGVDTLSLSLDDDTIPHISNRYCTLTNNLANDETSHFPSPTSSPMTELRVNTEADPSSSDEPSVPPPRVVNNLVPRRRHGQPLSFDTDMSDEANEDSDSSSSDSINDLLTPRGRVERRVTTTSDSFGTRPTPDPSIRVNTRASDTAREARQPIPPPVVPNVRPGTTTPPSSNPPPTPSTPPPSPTRPPINPNEAVNIITASVTACDDGNGTQHDCSRGGHPSHVPVYNSSESGVTMSVNIIDIEVGKPIEVFVVFSCIGANSSSTNETNESTNSTTFNARSGPKCPPVVMLTFRLELKFMTYTSQELETIGDVSGRVVLRPENKYSQVFRFKSKNYLNRASMPIPEHIRANVMATDHTTSTNKDIILFGSHVGSLIPPTLKITADKTTFPTTMTVDMIRRGANPPRTDDNTLNIKIHHQNDLPISLTNATLTMSGDNLGFDTKTVQLGVVPSGSSISYVHTFSGAKALPGLHTYKAVLSSRELEAVVGDIDILARRV